MLKSIRYIFRRLDQTRKIGQLNVAEAGVDHEGDAFIRLKDGFIFYGETALPKDKKYYMTLPASVRKKVPFQTMRVAIDIIMRYSEGGLKYGGPYKNDKYQPKEGDIASEMGAYRGYFILRLHEWVGASGKIIAIEPIPDNIRLLKKNLEANSVNNCIIIEKGVWHKRDKMVLSRKELENQSASLVLADQGNDQHSIPVDSLDNILHEAGVDHCDFMVIQLNGVEIDALQGLTNVRPLHMAIAARYDRPEQNSVEAIKVWMKMNSYSYQIEEERFIFSELTKPQSDD